MGSLIPGEVLVYERVDGTVYARYRDAPFNRIPRWEIGGTPRMDPTFEEWMYLNRLAKENETIRKQLDRLMTLYYTVKDDKSEETNE